MSQQLVSIACDESGSEGENIMGSRDPLFVHASTSIPLDEAETLLSTFRSTTRSQAPEIKSQTALRDANRPALLELLAGVGVRANIYLMEKPFFMSAKLVHTLIAEPLAEMNINFAAGGTGRMFASILHEFGPPSVGEERWQALLSTFNDLIRLHAREGAITPDPKEFIAALRDARTNCAVGYASEVFEWLWQFRTHIMNYGSLDSRSRFRELDPMFGTLTAVAMMWRVRLGDVPIEFVVDRYGSLDQDTIDRIVAAAADPLGLNHSSLPPGLLKGIRAVDSREDARVQVADILAGCGQAITAMAKRRIFDDPLQVATREMLDGNSMWADTSALNLLYDRAVPQYMQAWNSENRR